MPMCDKARGLHGAAELMLAYHDNLTPDSVDLQDCIEALRREVARIHLWGLVEKAWGCVLVQRPDRYWSVDQERETRLGPEVEDVAWSTLEIMGDLLASGSLEKGRQADDLGKVVASLQGLLLCGLFPARIEETNQEQGNG
jgi:hypothetical protein